MSKSMNKYHKCIQELGKLMPGWVKAGVLAVGVGVGVGGWSPGGGIEKAWGGGGTYAIKVEKSMFPSGTVGTFVTVEDMTKGLCESFSYTTEGTSVVFRGGFLSGLLEKFFSHAYLV